MVTAAWLPADHVLSTRCLDRIISADWDNGVVVVEPGMTLGELLTLSIPRGWFLRVTPGTQFATIGGAIANDVHGKNHHRQGTFGCHVPRFGLVRSVEGALTCSAKENPELYAATIGGLGLTGVIVWAEVHLMRNPIKPGSFCQPTFRLAR
jgi:FAD/FMN-containing dehydrogenase